MKQLASIVIAVLAIAGSAPLAQEKKDEHTGHHAATPAVAEMYPGEVRRIQKDTNKITLRHGEIRNLDMPPMTMVFTVSDPKWLDQFKVGDKVLFAVEKPPGGGYLITALQPAPPQ